MSEKVKRWGCFVLLDEDGDSHQISKPMDKGEWVQYEDYERLEKRFEELSSNHNQQSEDLHAVMEDYKNLEAKGEE